ncbi:hypothetical protein VTH06DRAFT_5150 [Thermothelomyces fergusii]
MDPAADGFPDRGPAVFAVTTAMLALATPFVAARMVSRFGIVRRATASDWFMVLAWLLAVFLSLSIGFGVKHGLGRHDRDIDPAKKPILRMCEYVFSILYNPSLMATKTSILILYLRLSKNTQPVLRLGSWVTLAVVILAGVVLTFLNIFQCRPIAAAWDVNVASARCIPLLTEFICTAPINVTTDLAILALPIPVLTGMHLPQRQKTILVLTFGLGIFVTVVDVVRIYYLQQAIEQAPTTSSADPMAMLGQSTDFSWNASLSLMWSAVEVNVGIICACIPTLKPLFKRILPSVLVHADASPRSQTMTVANDAQRNTRAGAPARDGGRVRIKRSLPPRRPAASPCTSPAEAYGGDGGGSGKDAPICDSLSASLTNSSLPVTPSDCRPLPATGPAGETETTEATAQGRNAMYCKFVTLSRRGNLLQTDGRENLCYNGLASILFLLWGFSYGLLNTLNNTIAVVTGMSMAQNLSLTAAYFGGGYFLGPALVGGWLLRHDEHHRREKLNKRRGEASRRDVVGREGGQGDGHEAADDPVRNGEETRRRAIRAPRVKAKKRKERMAREVEEPVGGFKATFIAGLLVYGLGTIMFWPGAVLGAYGGFMISSFVVGFGLAVLETAANPFLVLCGPPRYGDARLLLAQGVQAVGSVLSSLLADRVFFARRFEQPDGKMNLSALIDVQWTYLAITLLTVFLALFFYYVPIPEVSDAELAELAARSRVDPKIKSIGGIPLRTWSLSLAILTQWCYVSSQENISRFFEPLIESFVDGPAAAPASTNSWGRPPGLALSLANCMLVAHSAFALSRFLAGGVCILAVRRPAQRFFLPSARTILTLSISLSALLALVIGPIWPLAFSLGLRGQGSRTKRAATWLTMGASGHAIWPFVSYGITQAGGSVQVSQVVVVVLLAVAGTYPAFLWLVRDARTLVDVAPEPPAAAAGDGAGETGGGGGRSGDVEAGVESGERTKSGFGHGDS